MPDFKLNGFVFLRLVNEYMKKVFFIILSLLPIFADAYAVQPSDSTKVYFKLGQRYFYPDFKNNSESIGGFIGALRKASADGTLRSVEIRAYASPDGSERANNRLSRLRSRELTDYIVKHSGVDTSMVVTRSEGIAWDELRSMVFADDRVPARAEVLDVLDNHPEYSSNMRKIALMGLHGGVPYKWMFDNLFPNLRNAVGLYIYVNDDKDTVDDKGIAGDNESDEMKPVPVEAEQEVTEQVQASPVERGIENEPESIANHDTSDVSASAEPLHLFALKTNLLYDAMLMPSLELEWRINHHWSVAGEANVAWWHNDGKHKYYQVMYLGGECRYWFGKLRPWHGMYAGVMAGGGKYDLENGHKGYKGEASVTGLTFGYMFPITRCLSFDAEIGVGYMFTRFDEYVPYDGHYIYQRTKDMNYFGPIKAKFSFVWRFWDVNKSRKGGKR